MAARRVGQRLRFLIAVAACICGLAMVSASVASGSIMHYARGQDHDAKVWVNTSSGVYHCPGARYYGTTKAGAYLLESVARQKGYRPAYGRTCGPLATPSESERKLPLAAATPLRDGSIKVWVNTASGVYHCPGTRYYGNTRAGEYVTEAAAKAAGKRPAYGRSCR